MASAAAVRPCPIVCSLNGKEAAFNPLSSKNVVAAPRRWRGLAGCASTGAQQKQCRMLKSVAVSRTETLATTCTKEQPEDLSMEAASQGAFSMTPSLLSASASALLLQASVFAAPALAELPAYTDEEFVQILLAGGAFGIFYLLIAPLAIYQYCRVRWLKKSTPETVFMYALVFLFFPGLLLTGPFINFRFLPRDPSKMP